MGAGDELVAGDIGAGVRGDAAEGDTRCGMASCGSALAWRGVRLAGLACRSWPGVEGRRLAGEPAAVWAATVVVKLETLEGDSSAPEALSAAKCSRPGIGCMAVLEDCDDRGTDGAALYASRAEHCAGDGAAVAAVARAEDGNGAGGRWCVACGCSVCVVVCCGCTGAGWQDEERLAPVDGGCVDIAVCCSEFSVVVVSPSVPVMKTLPLLPQRSSRGTAGAASVELSSPDGEGESATVCSGGGEGVRSAGEDGLAPRLPSGSGGGGVSCCGNVDFSTNGPS